MNPCMFVVISPWKVLNSEAKNFKQGSSFSNFEFQSSFGLQGFSLCRNVTFCSQRKRKVLMYYLSGGVSTFLKNSDNSASNWIIRPPFSVLTTSMVNESSAFYVLLFKVGFQIYLSYCMLFIPASRIQTNRRLTLKVLIKEMSLTKPTKVSVMMAISLFMEAIILILSVSIFSRWYELHADTHQLSGYWSGNEWHVDNLLVTFHMNLNNKKQFSTAQNA